MTLETWERAASACTAYLVATTLTAPLDRVKTTLQSNPNLSRAGARATASMIIRQDGMSGLFRGLGPALAMAPAGKPRVPCTSRRLGPVLVHVTALCTR